MKYILNDSESSYLWSSFFIQIDIALIRKHMVCVMEWCMYLFDKDFMVDF